MDLAPQSLLCVCNWTSFLSGERGWINAFLKMDYNLYIYIYNYRFDPIDFIIPTIVRVKLVKHLSAAPILAPPRR